ncbi:chromophore lyase [Neisseria shayeganii]|uniref:Chromophore lyase n=1 Tax=Neisseria shayeganii TaxID=607712 RepID=A0A7D7NB06_9NEIS|nr:chromophore lyase [Neisseria shayeganii]
MNVDRLNLLIDIYGTQANLSDKIGKPAAQISQWVGGYRNMSTSTKRQIEAALDLQTGWLDTPIDSNAVASDIQSIAQVESNVSAVGQIVGWSDDTPPDPEEFALVPFYKDVALAAGNGSTTEDDHNGFKLAFAKSTLRKCSVQEDKAVCVSVSGDSMEPVLPDGATVGVDTGSRHIKDGQMYAIRHGDLLRVKVLRKNANGTVRIISFNSEAYPEEVAALGEEVDIIGRVFSSMVIYP